MKNIERPAICCKDDSSMAILFTLVSIVKVEALGQPCLLQNICAFSFPSVFHIRCDMSYAIHLYYVVQNTF